MIRVFRRRTAGFTIIELALVLVVLGILAAVFIPMAQVAHENAMRERDITSLEAARDAMIGYIRVNEGIPCVDSTGTQISDGENCDAEATLDLLGIRTYDSRNNTFTYDVNDTLTVAGLAASGDSICTALTDIIDPAVPPATPPDPSVCDSSNTNTGSTACTAASEMAFVLVGRGPDRCLNLENTHADVVNNAVCHTAVANNRTFENSTRIHSRYDDDGYYEDLVYTVSPTELAEIMECTAGGGSGSGYSICSTGETFIQASYGDNSGWLGLTMDGVCYAVGAGTMAALGCQVDSTTIELRSTSSCGGTTFYSGLADGLDTNDDGRADIVCNSTVCNYR